MGLASNSLVFVIIVNSIVLQSLLFYMVGRCDKMRQPERNRNMIAPQIFHSRGELLQAAVECKSEKTKRQIFKNSYSKYAQIKLRVIKKKK